MTTEQAVGQVLKLSRARECSAPSARKRIDELRSRSRRRMITPCA